METLSIVVPCFNEEPNITDFYGEILNVAPLLEEQGVSLTISFVDDGSTDGTAEAVRQLHARDERVHLLRFSRNFGKEAAIYAGLEKSTGEYVVVMDCDLQDPPSLLPEMLRLVREEGYDSVGTRRVTRKGEPPVRSFFARRFYRWINRMSHTEIVDGARDYRLMTRQFVEAVLSVKEYNRFSKGIFSWVGFRNKWLEYENVERRKGETKWSFRKLFVYAIEGMVAFTTAPLAFASVFGVVCCILALVFLLVIFIRALVMGDPTPGWPSMVCIILLVSGVQMFCIGIVGQYLSKTYLEVKKRPIYLLREEL
ncbi:MAG: glycosyltransferase family 2 protein [Lachnospiraceae bacterium]|nr:glycosyltransferase family 2 protein [Lachnospiraceae bacterium]